MVDLLNWQSPGKWDDATPGQVRWTESVLIPDQHCKLHLLYILIICNYVSLPNLRGNYSQEQNDENITFGRNRTLSFQTKYQSKTSAGQTFRNIQTWYETKEKTQMHREMRKNWLWSHQHQSKRALLLAKIIFQGEEKILVTGPWYSQTSPYQILFDGVPVSTSLVQSGVLRCFCPG